MNDYVVELNFHSRLKWEQQDEGGRSWRCKVREQAAEQARHASHDRVVIRGNDGKTLESWPASEPPQD